MYLNRIDVQSTYHFLDSLASSLAFLYRVNLGRCRPLSDSVRLYPIWYSHQLNHFHPVQQCLSRIGVVAWKHREIEKEQKKTKLRNFSFTTLFNILFRMFQLKFTHKYLTTTRHILLRSHQFHFYRKQRFELCVTYTNDEKELDICRECLNKS